MFDCQAAYLAIRTAANEIYAASVAGDPDNALQMYYTGLTEKVERLQDKTNSGRCKCMTYCEMSDRAQRVLEAVWEHLRLLWLIPVDDEMHEENQHNDFVW